MSTKNITKTWALYQSTGFLLGWFFHSVISHLWTGEHEYTLTISQFIMHSVSLTGCVLLVLYFQHRAAVYLFQINLGKYWLLYLTVPIIVFWIGFYLKAVPLDVFLWFLSVGLINGRIMSNELRLTTNRWLYWSVLSAVIGFVIAAAVLIPLEPYLSDLNGLALHIVLFTLLGALSGVPMAIVGGIVLSKTIKSSN